MKIDAEKEGIQWAQKSDPRITKTGSLIRALRIDELPQLLCVLKGDMSLIGPRPERPEIESKKLKNIPYYSSRYIMKPGISGWAQVNYPYGASVKDAERKSNDVDGVSHDPVKTTNDKLSTVVTPSEERKMPQWLTDLNLELQELRNELEGEREMVSLQDKLKEQRLE